MAWPKLLLLPLLCARPTTALMLCELPTPSLLVDLDVLPAAPEEIGRMGAAARAVALKDALFIHARVVAKAPREIGFHRAPGSVATIDCALPSGGAYLSVGLNNAVGGDVNYFWSRSCGPGARRAAPGIGCEGTEDRRVDLRWLSEAEAVAAGSQPQTGDGKWSEWVEFVAVGDEVDLVPLDANGALETYGGAVRGVTRDEQPPGAQPLVRGAWTWS